MLIYKENNVFEEALERIRMLFDTHDDIIVSMSGGKDSTVLFNLALTVAKEKKPSPSESILARSRSRMATYCGLYVLGNAFARG